MHNKVARRITAADTHPAKSVQLPTCLVASKVRQANNFVHLL